MAENSIPLSKIRRIGDTYYLSGELGFDDNQKIVPGGIEAETKQVLERISATLATEGLTLGDVVSCTCYLADKADFAGFNKVYREYFSEPFPTRTTVEAQLMIDARLEVTSVVKARD